MKHILLFALAFVSASSQAAEPLKTLECTKYYTKSLFPSVHNYGHYPKDKHLVRAKLSLQEDGGSYNIELSYSNQEKETLTDMGCNNLSIGQDGVADIMCSKDTDVSNSNIVKTEEFNSRSLISNSLSRSIRIRNKETQERKMTELEYGSFACK